ncbi:hypothetical protein BJ741DRAFT_614674 [Chytriomyces cf. hyalinus JEL632]|nr:hypothetical protein BJ741DRAFT_614674 [Chytriomyces cf. hyalinus JEL632]
MPVPDTQQLHPEPYPIMHASTYIHHKAFNPMSICNLVDAGPDPVPAAAAATTNQTRRSFPSPPVSPAPYILASSKASNNNNNSNHHHHHAAATTMSPSLILSQLSHLHNANLPLKAVCATKPPRYACNVCGKGFRRILFLHKHMQQTHFEECPYVCNRTGCGHMFGTSLELSRHDRQFHV